MAPRGEVVLQVTFGPSKSLKGSETPISPSLLECFPGGGIREDRSQESVGPFFGELA